MGSGERERESFVITITNYTARPILTRIDTEVML